MRSLLAGVVGLFCMAVCAVAAPITCWFPPEWRSKASQAKAIADALSKESGLEVRPRIAESYPQIIDAMQSGEPALTYAGSFVQAVIAARNAGTPLVQGVDGKELYGGVCVALAGETAQKVLFEAPTEVAYAAGATSGEVCAKAATGGKASVPVANHNAACSAVMSGKAKAAFVKNWWWEANKDKFPKLAATPIAGISEEKNPDNVLTASKAVSLEQRGMLKLAATKCADVMGVKSVREFPADGLAFTAALAGKAKLSLADYQFQK